MSNSKYNGGSATLSFSNLTGATSGLSDLFSLITGGVTVSPAAPNGASTSQTGLLVIYKNAKAPEADLITINP